MGRVTLDVALQATGLLRQHQIVVRQREVVHTDVHVTVAGHGLDGLPEQFQPDLEAGRVTPQPITISGDSEHLPGDRTMCAAP